MYKVVIVDDDRIIRRGLSSVIPWEEHGFELVGEAPDGEKGLELIEATNPQIVISDIQMPFMDGLEMARAIREKTPKTKIILLTGYEDFKYAHEAIKLKAFDYLLKPVETSNLIEKLKQASKEFELEAQREKHISQSHPYLQQQFLKKLSQMPLNNEEMKKELALIGVKEEGGMFTALYFKLDDQNEGSVDSNTELMKDKIMIECKRIIDHSSIQGHMINAENEHFAVFLCKDDMELAEFEKAVVQLSEQFLTIVKEKLNTSVTITRGRIYQEMSDLRCSFLEALTAMRFRHIIGKNKVYSIGETESPHFTLTIADYRFEEELIHLLQLGLPEKVIALLEDTREDLLKNKSLTLQDTVLKAIKVISLIFHESAKWAKTWDQTKFMDTQREVVRMQTIDEIFVKIKEIAIDLAHYVNQLNGNQKHSLVDKAIDFIKNNYQVGNLSLQRVADEVHISSAYLSNLFKVEKGFNFGDFLLETRMKKAMELFRQTDLKTYEIAEKIGYSNPQYFSSSFKKYTGYSPAEFRKLK